jgi:hypothetical protein
MLEVDAKAIARIKQFEFGGRYGEGLAYPGRVYFVPDETLLLEEASSPTAMLKASRSAPGVNTETTIAREDEAARFRDERTCHSRQARYRFDVPISCAVDHVNRIIAGMCDVHPICGRMNIGVIEPAIGSMSREFDVPE